MSTRLAIISTHPIQYYAPWFSYLAKLSVFDLRIFYLWDFGVSGSVDPAFQVSVKWDLPLLEGYAHEFVPNRSRRPGTDHFWGIDNPELLARLIAFDPAAILCIGYNFVSFARLLVRRLSVPLMLRGDSHRIVPQTGPFAAVKRMVLASVFRRFSAFLFVGLSNLDYYRLHGVPEEKLFFSPHAVDNSRFTDDFDDVKAKALVWRRELGISDRAVVVLFVGKFENKKSPFDLLNAYSQVATRESALLFVGNGVLESQLRQSAAGRHDVFFAPFQNQSMMPRTYAAGDILVLPSCGPSETWGLCVNEAMCLSRPVITSSHVGCTRDLVIEGQTGLSFPAGDQEKLSDVLRQMLDSPGKRHSMGRGAFQRVQQYSYAQASNGLISAVSSVLGH